MLDFGSPLEVIVFDGAYTLMSVWCEIKSMRKTTHLLNSQVQNSFGTNMFWNQSIPGLHQSQG